MTQVLLCSENSHKHRLRYDVEKCPKGGSLNPARQQIRPTVAIDAHCQYRGKLTHSEGVQDLQTLAELTDQLHVPAETKFSVTSRTTNCSYNQYLPMQTPAHHMMQPPAVPFQYLLTFTS
jgi:hypothetical protein